MELAWWSLPVPKEHRALTLRAAADAAQAIELDHTNAKAWLYKGQALLEALHQVFTGSAAPSFYKGPY